MRGRVLIVDDDDTLRGVLGEALGRAGFEVVEAEDGERGVAAALNHRPDLVVSDIVMPRMDGWELCQTLRSLPSTRTVPFVFLTSLDKTPEKVLGLRLGADDYLTKPFTLEAVLERVRMLVDRVSDRDGLLDGRGVEVPAAKIERILVDTIEVLRATSRTGVISVESGPARGVIYLEGGSLRHAALGKLRGEEALLAMLRLEKSDLTFREKSYPDLPSNFRLSWEEFISSLADRG